MSPTSSKLAGWGIRFVVLAVVYLATWALWLNQAHGWEGLTVFAAGIMFGIIAVPSWAAAIALERFIVPARLSLLVHPVMTGLAFIVLAQVVLVGFLDVTLQSMWKDILPFVLLIVVAALADVIAGLLLKRWTSAPSGRTP